MAEQKTHAKSIAPVFVKLSFMLGLGWIEP